jgi:cell division septation protein DedD
MNRRFIVKMPRFDTIDPRRRALRRAAAALGVAALLLLVALWFESRAPLPDSTTEVLNLPPPVFEPVSAPAAAVAPLEGEKEAEREETVPPEEATAKLAPPDGFMVQLGVFGAMDNAEALRKNVAARNLPVRIESRVVVGPFGGKAEAEAMREQLRREGIAEGIVVPPRNTLPSKAGTQTKTAATRSAQASRQQAAK